MKIFWKEKMDSLFEGLTEVHVVEGKHFTCISVRELVCVFHLLKRPVLKAKVLAMRCLHLTWILLKEVYVFEGRL